MSEVEFREVALPDGGDGVLPAALALPAAEHPRPGVLVLHELWGLTEDMRRIARRLAGAGYVALAPELYGPGRRRACVARAVRDLRGGGELGLGRASEAFRELCRRPEVDAGRVGAIGFCLGGGFALLLGAREPAGAVSVNYGRVPERSEELEGICPVVGSYGGRDRQLLPHAERLERLLSERHVPHDVKLYPEAGAQLPEPERAALARAHPAPARRRRLPPRGVRGRLGKDPRLLSRAPRSPGPIMTALLRLAMWLHRTLYRASGGRIGDRRGAVPILLLTTVGRVTGKRRTVPVQYLDQGERLAVVASNGGRPRHPGWFFNLRAEPRVEVEIGRERTAMHARVATEEERERLWPKVVELWSGYEEYQRGTTRRIPLVILESSR
ncbi:MAG TPA: nitroreductase/quinone reductase family protein [Gaiellaceae bacterium]|nr:nitroreductase/quinone reductase family protein [Gaiellaceae bacterium]